jgi:hypothetical protein
VSYDLEIRSVDPIDLPNALLDPDKWQRKGGAWVRTGASLELSVYPSFLTSLTLSPFGAPFADTLT